jgi:hypothetical protein
MSRLSEKTMSGEYEDTELEDPGNETLRSTEVDSKTQKESKEIDLKNHPGYKENDPENSDMIQMRNLTEFRKAVNHKTDGSRWMRYIANVIEYDEKMFNKHYELNAV